MRKMNVSLASVAMLLLACGTTFGGEDAKAPAKGRESELLVILKSSTWRKKRPTPAWNSRASAPRNRWNRWPRSWATKNWPHGPLCPGTDPEPGR